MGTVMFQRKKPIKKTIAGSMENIDPCLKCAFKKQDVYVPSEIHAGSRVLVVAEAPGRTEVEKRRPLIGRSGSLARQALSEVGLDEPCDVANVVSCRPTDAAGNNRTPTPTEIRRCSPKLQTILNSKKYELIILMGGIAVDSILPMDVKIHDFGGHVFIAQNQKILPVYHPSYIMRVNDPEKEKIWKADLKWGIDILKGRIKKVGYTLIDSAEKHQLLIDRLKEYKGFAAVDIETTDLDPKLGILICCGFNVGGENFIYPLIGVGGKEGLQAALDAVKIGVFHNAMFDIGFLWAKGYKFRADIRDTQVLCYLLDEHRRDTGLKAKKMIKELLNIRYQGIAYDMIKASKEEIYSYCAEDVQYEMKLFKKVWDILPERLRKSYEIFLGNAEYPVIEMLNRGFKVDQTRAEAIKGELERSMKDIEQSLNEIFGETRWSSPMQIGKIFESLGINTDKKTPTGRMQIRAEDLETLQKHKILCSDAAKEKKAHFLLNSLLEYKTLFKNYTTYVLGVLSKLGADGRIRADYSFTRTLTGRLACSNPNIQSTPRDTKLRGIYGVDDEYSLVYADWSQIELRLAAIIFDLPKMLMAFKEGKDIHAWTAKEILGKALEEITKDERQLAKACNFGLIYGMFADSLQEFAEKEYGVIMTREEAQLFRNRIFEAYGIREGHQRVLASAKKFGYAESFFGRRRNLSAEFRDIDLKVRSHAERQAYNAPVQGAANDVNLLLMNLIYEKKEERNLDAFFVATVHDMFGLECANRDVKILQEVIEEARLEVEDIVSTLAGKEIPPLLLDLKVSDHWE